MKDQVGVDERATTEKIKVLRNVQEKEEEGTEDVWKERKMKDLVGGNERADVAKIVGLGNVQEKEEKDAKGF